jgi:hypothetical protein
MQSETRTEQTIDLIERVARALKPQAFKIYDAGYPSGLRANWLAETAFRNAEKNVKRARKDAEIAVKIVQETQNADHHIPSYT